MVRRVAEAKNALLYVKWNRRSGANSRRTEWSFVDSRKWDPEGTSNLRPVLHLPKRPELDPYA